MELHCKYCGFTVHYEDGRGWFPEYAARVEQHVLDAHVKRSTVEHFDENGVLHIVYGAYISPGYSHGKRGKETPMEDGLYKKPIAAQIIKRNPVPIGYGMKLSEEEIDEEVNNKKSRDGMTFAERNGA